MSSQPPDSHVSRVLAGGGEMGALARTIDWGRTPVGPVSTWPQSLCTAVSIVLESRFPMMLAWGTDFTQFYNDRFRPILGASKHPAAFGQSTAVTFAEAWHIISPLFAQVMGGQAVSFDDMLVPLDRHGFLEECYFVYSYSPVQNEASEVAGLLVVCTETTGRVVAERRLRALRELAVHASRVKPEQDAWSDAAAVLTAQGADLPFALLYRLDPDGLGATRAGAGDARIGPSRVPLGGEDAVWPLARAQAEGGVFIVDDVAARIGDYAGPAWPESVRQALIVPVTRPGLAQPYGYLVAGLSPRLPFDEQYRDFLVLVGDQIATGIANARAFEEEKQRAEALLALDRQKTAFFSNVSHEFRTPLTLILGPLTEALDAGGALPAELRASLESAYRGSLRLLKLVNTLLDVSRLEAGRMTARFEPLDLAAATRDLVSTFQSAMDKAGLAFEVACDPLDAPVYVDRGMWEQIVLNLISNAFKFTLAGRVTVAVQSRGDVVALVVADTGGGIPEHELPHLFDRFHRVDGAPARSHEGTGIGLSLVRELVTLHGGEISVSSRLRHGTTFTVTLPTGTAHLPAAQVAAEPRPADATAFTRAFAEEALRWLAAEPAAAAGEPTAVQGRVLFADDNADIRDYAQRLLGGRWHVDMAADGQEALRLARAHPPDVIVTDIMMPGLDGFGLLRELRADPRLARTPVIMLSARAGEDARVDGIAAGADDYLVKPFSARDLVARVDAQVLKSRLRAIEQQQAARLDRLFTHAPMALAVVRGPEHVYEFANGPYLALVGHRPVIGRTFRSAFPELAGQGPYELLDRVRSSGEPYVGRSMPFVLDRGGGPEEAMFDFVAQPIADDHGQVEAIALIAHEVTELARARAVAESSNRAKDEFLATLSHELRTPLNAILGYLQMLRGGAIAADRFPAVFETIERNARMQKQLIEDVLDVSRIVSGKLRLDVQRVDLAQIVRDAIETVTPAADAKGVRLQPIVDHPGVPVAGDPQRLQQVIWNLLSNAVKFTPRGGRVQVRLERVNSHLELTVSDTGEGVAPHLLPHLFERFWQANSSIARTHGGLGLGLSISRHLVEAHGGRIEATSPGPGLGTTIRVELPLVIVHAAEAGAAERVHPAAEVASPFRLADLSGVRVLLVDDDADALEMARNVLEAAGARVTIAPRATPALQHVAATAFDVAVLDIGMPEMDGYALLRRIREGGTMNADIPAVALTAYARSVDRTRALQAGFQMHLGKPVDPSELTEVVRSLAQRGQRT